MWIPMKIFWNSVELDTSSFLSWRFLECLIFMILLFLRWFLLICGWKMIPLESNCSTKATSIVDQHVDLETTFADSSPHDLCDKQNQPATVYDYSKELISLALLFLNFKDAVKERDGERVIRMWKYFLLFFRATKLTNYTKEALTLLTVDTMFIFLLTP